MQKINNIDWVVSMFKILADNEYSCLWDLVEDFMCNGHHVSVKDSTQFKHVIIDNGYVDISDNYNISVLSVGKTFKGREYVKWLLEQPVKEKSKMIDVGTGTKEEIRKAIADKALSESKALNEDNTIKVFPAGSEMYNILDTAAKLLNLFTNKEYYVGETYFDYGQGWKWTTILEKDSTWGAVQALSPKEQNDILMANSPTDLGKAVDAVIHKKSYTPSK